MFLFFLGFLMCIVGVPIVGVCLIILGCVQMNSEPTR